MTFCVLIIIPISENLVSSLVTYVVAVSETRKQKKNVSKPEREIAIQSK